MPSARSSDFELQSSLGRRFKSLNVLQLTWLQIQKAMLRHLLTLLALLSPPLCFLPPVAWHEPIQAPAIRVGPSFLASDLANLAHEARRVLRAGADFLHLDVFDGNWVRGAFSFGPMVVKALRQHEPNAFLEVHLCVTQPAQYLEELANAGASRVLLHFEALNSVSAAKAAAQLAHQLRLQVGLALAPQTRLDSDVLEAAESYDSLLAMTVPPGFGGQTFMREVLPKLRQLREAFPAKSIEASTHVSLLKFIQNSFKFI